MRIVTQLASTKNSLVEGQEQILFLLLETVLRAFGRSCRGILPSDKGSLFMDLQPAPHYYTHIHACTLAYTHMHAHIQICTHHGGVLLMMEFELNI